MTTYATVRYNSSNPYCIGNLIEGFMLWLWQCFILRSNPYCIGNLIEAIKVEQKLFVAGEF